MDCEKNTTDLFREHLAAKSSSALLKYAHKAEILFFSYMEAYNQYATKVPGAVITDTLVF